MVQVDLITGFLGAGKTTFLRRYVRYLVAQGHNVCILENDFGAVNVDAMLVQDLLGPNCDLETISGGCDCDTHQRRMRTKLIAMAMRGFDRVVVEPSGIFDVDEFFDVLRDDPLDRWYHIGNVIAIVDAMLPETLSPQAEYVLASETANAGRVLVSRTQLAGQQQTAAAVAAIAACGCRQASCEKLHFDEHEAFSSLCFLEQHLTLQQLQAAADHLFADAACGHVLRVKGFAPDPQGTTGWLELNATAAGRTLEPIPQGQDVLIVIGEGLDKAAIEARLKA